MQEANEHRLAAKEKTIDAQANLALKQLQGSFGSSPNRLIIPSNNRNLAFVTEARRKAFWVHLLECLEILQEQPPEEANHSEPPTAKGAFLLQACITCRGFCCMGGGDHAHLNPRALRQVHAADPEKDDNTLLQQYLEHIPEQAYENSCLFHTESGCALPPKMRSYKCHNHLCHPLQKARATPPEGPILAISTSGTDVVRMACFDQERYLPLTVEDDE